MKGLLIVSQRTIRGVEAFEYVAEDGGRWVIERRLVADHPDNWKGTPHWFLRRLGDNTPYIAWVEQSYDTSGDETTENPDWKTLAEYVDQYKTVGDDRADLFNAFFGGLACQKK